MRTRIYNLLAALAVLVLLTSISTSAPLNQKQKEKVTVINNIPDPTDFIPVEKEPSTDMAELQKKVVYPAKAKSAGIEGKVIIRALIGKNGKVSKMIVEKSDNVIFDKAAKDAIKSSKFTPAIQNKVPVASWVSIPIMFKLK